MLIVIENSSSEIRQRPKHSAILDKLLDFILVTLLLPSIRLVHLLIRCLLLIGCWLS